MRERELAVSTDQAQEIRATRRPARTIAMWIVAAVLLVGGAAVVMRWGNRAPATPTAESGQILARVQADGLVIALGGSGSGIDKGRSTLALEFRSDAGEPIDVGDVRLTGTMAMPGMTMTAKTSVTRTSEPGRYRVTSDFPMAGVWQLTVEWNGPARQGTAVMNGEVR
jgi:hypothetical protein